MSSINGQIKTKLIDGGKTEGFESLHIRYGSVGWHPDSQLIVFVAKSQGKDLLYVMNVRNKKIVRRLEAKLDRIFSPSFSPTGDHIAIRGVSDGAADIYTIDYSTGKIVQLTDDACDDLAPSWSPDGKYVIFSSDRPLEGKSWTYGDYTIFKVNADTDRDPLLRKPQPIIAGHRTSHVSSPLWVKSPDSLASGEKILFISDISGIRNLYAFDLGSSELTQLTNVIGGIFTVSVSSNAQLLAFSSYENLGWDVYVWKHPLRSGTEPGPSLSFDTRYAEIPEKMSETESKSLGFRFSPDWGGGALSLSSGGSVMGSVAFAMSDLLGNHSFFLRTTSPSDLLANYYISYFYLPRRLNVGVATSQEKHYYWTGEDTFYEQKMQGVGALFNYPFSKFQRVDLEVTGYRAAEKRLLLQTGEEISQQTFYQIVPSVSWIYDNSLWGATGPVNGSRRKLTLHSIAPLVESPILYNSYKLDLRKYVRITPQYSFAMRLMNTGIWGEDADYLVKELGWPWLGGSDDLRGYEFGEFSGRNAGLFNLELRHPLIDCLKVAFPLPLSIRGIRGALFCDFGYALDDVQTFRFFKEGRLKDLKSDFGCGIRLRFPYFVVKFDAAWNTDLIDVSKTQWRFSLSPEF
jgi:Tol biopolymer transport system component